MARQPFFSGNYGSALGQIDTRPIMQGAAAQAAMYQNLGANIGGAIEKYQLNKVKREKEESTAMGTLAGMSPEERSQFIQGNPKLEKAVENALSDTAKPADFSMINSGSAPFLAGRARGLQETLRKTQAESAALGLEKDKAIQETLINIEKNKGILSDLITKRRVEQDPKLQELFDKQISETIANLGMGDLGRKVKTAELEGQLKTMPAVIEARKATAEAVPGQVKSATAARKRADDTANALLDAMGGPEGAAEMTVEEKNLSMNKIQSYINYMDRQGQASVLKALVGTAPPSVTKQAATLSAFQGDLLGYKVRDPINGGMISFEKYLELNNSEGDSDYPLTGDNAGTAGRINATFLNSQKQIDDLVKTVEVQAVVPGAVDGTSASGLPSAIDPSMTPAQADAAKTARITEIRTLIDNLNTEFDNLETPNATMPATAPISATWGGYGGAPTYSAPQPATLEYLDRRKREIPAEIAALRAELTQLANY